MSAVFCLLAAATLGRLNLLPYPKQVEEIGPPLRLAREAVVHLSPALAHDEDAAFAARELARTLREAGLEVKVAVS